MAVEVGSIGGRRVAIPPAVRKWTVRSVVAVVAMAAVATIGPVRQAASEAVSRIIFWVVSPLAPSLTGFHELPQPTTVVAADGSPLGRLDGTRGTQPVRLGDLPPAVPHAVLAAEDARFFHHAGVNPAALVRAALASVRGRVEGGSTISQQLAKLDYTGSSRTVLRKVRELLYAVQLERKYSKNDLLEAYLNQVYFGDGNVGLGAASQQYFGVPPQQLTAVQAATLAGKIRAPGLLDPYRRPDLVVTRRNEVLRAMAHDGWLDRRELAADEAAPLGVQPAAPDPANLERPFLDDVQREALGLDAVGGSGEARAKQLFTGGYTIHTTLDPRAFNAAVDSARARLGRPGDPGTAVASVQPGDGAIRVLFSGLDASQSFDIASQGQRQPGSAFKPFVYLAALRQGIDPRTTFDSSSPKTLHYQGQTFTVTNFDGAGSGRMSIDDALVRSVNTVYAQLGLQVGPANVVGAAHDDGITQEMAAVPAVSLGGLDHGVSPLQMAAAYATFAARGLYAAPYTISSISDRRGRVVYGHKAQTRQAFDPIQTGVLTAALERVVAQGTGTAADLGRPVAGKTGTTSGYTDGWFVGYVPQLATAVWVGDPTGDRPLPHVHGQPLTGGSFPALIFSDEMKTALSGTPVQPLATATPDQLVQHTTLPPATFTGVTPFPPPTTGVPFPTSSVFSPGSVPLTTAPSGVATTTPTVRPGPVTTAPATTTAPVTTATTAPPPTTTAPVKPTTTTAPPPPPTT